jgi:hypothetical protein
MSGRGVSHSETGEGGERDIDDDKNKTAHDPRFPLLL